MGMEDDNQPTNTLTEPQFAFIPEKSKFRNIGSTGTLIIDDTGSYVAFLEGFEKLKPKEKEGFFFMPTSSLSAATTNINCPDNLIIVETDTLDLSLVGKKRVRLLTCFPVI